MTRLTIHLDEDEHEDLRALARRRNTPIAALVRYALDKAFEEALDDISSKRALEEAGQHPEGMVTLDAYLEQRGLALPSKAHTP